MVCAVTLVVNAPMFPTTPDENPCTPLAIEAAKSEPGKWGSEVAPLAGAPLTMEGLTLGMDLKVGS